MLTQFCCFAKQMEFLEKYWLFGLGFFAQGLFGIRLLVQLFHSEKAGKSVSPIVFWQISLLASFIFLIYGILRNDAVIIIGQTLSYFIYIRNLQLKNAWKLIFLPMRLLILTLPFAAWAWIVKQDSSSGLLFSAFSFKNPFVILGTIGQLMLNLRYLYQWYHSEKEKESILPLGFWIISAVASVLVVVYAVQRIEPVLLLSQSLGLVVYLRNIILYLRKSALSS
jgi:lipid-A-disaccharide synthase-like uncharacterized protein